MSTSIYLDEKQEIKLILKKNQDKTVKCFVLVFNFFSNLNLFSIQKQASQQKRTLKTLQVNFKDFAEYIICQHI